MRKNENVEEKICEDSLPRLADKLVSDTREILNQAKSEEDLRIGFEKLLEPIKLKLNLKCNSKYEKFVYNGRSDAVHGQVIIEYESPRTFSSKRNIDHAYEQLVGYLSNEAQETKSTKFVGVGFDGKQIFFVQYRGKDEKKIDKNDFFIRGPYDFNQESAITFLIHLRALSRLPLTAENLSQKFGPQSDLAPKMVSAFANALEYWGDKEHIRTFFNEWKRLFGIVYGEQFNNSPQEKRGQSLSRLYNIKREMDFQELLFSIHTYFALLMKLIAAELLTLQETSFGSSLASELAHSSDDELKAKLEDIESGGVYKRKGITNFLEGDFFRWYLYALDSPELKEAIKDTARALSEFEPATSTLDPASTRDLLKKLYQYLVPQEVRHQLGEYYTPDWLAELLLNEVGYDGNTLKRFLDPACGSGTFLVLAIQRAIKHGREKEKIPDLEIAKRIVSNIWGFDLNPLAVIAARTNYLFALGDLVNNLKNIEIPIYLADSILWPQRTGQMQLRPRGESIEIQTSLKTFYVPSIWICNNGFLMSKAAPLIEQMAKDKYSVDEAMKRLRKEGLVFPPHEEIVEEFYKEILELEQENKNGIWARFLKNAFAPMAAGKFDFVVGNPPWIRWGYLSEQYRKVTLSLWKKYGLFSLKGQAARLGSGEKDFSMLFVYASADYYLEKRAKLGFLITQEVFKSKGAGEGFRRFQLGDKDYLKVLKAHDLASIQPFEGAVNKTAMIVLKKGEQTKYPLPYFVWEKKKGTTKVETGKTLTEVLPMLLKKELIAQPVENNTGSWITIPERQKKILCIHGRSSYRAYRGASTEPYSVFWLEVKQILPNGYILVHNLADRGKKKLRKVEESLEQDLIFPSVSGACIERWGIKNPNYLLMVQNPRNREPFGESEMKKNWPRTYNYLTKFRDVLLQRASRTIKELAERTAFYTMYGIGPHTVQKYKVVWKRMANDIYATVVSVHKTPFGYKKVIPTDTTSFFSTNSESEAHYLCAIINSNPVRDFIKSFSSAGRGFGTPSVMEHVGIPQFDSKNQLHQNLAEISQKCHKLKMDGDEKEIKELESNNDELVRKLFGV
jgi:hypothetical protein